MRIFRNGRERGKEGIYAKSYPIEQNFDILITLNIAVERVILQAVRKSDTKIIRRTCRIAKQVIRF